MTGRTSIIAAARARACEIMPAVGLAVSVTAVIAGLQLMPFGKAMLLVRVRDADPRSALVAAAMAGGTLIGIPAPGFAVVYADASKTRSAVGLAVTWKGNALCLPTP